MYIRNRFQKMATPITVSIKPKDVMYKKYVLPNTLGDIKAEKIAAHLLEYWQENEEWKAVSLFTAYIIMSTGPAQTKDIREVDPKASTQEIIEYSLEYLNKNGYVEFQRFKGGNNQEIFAAPTDKLVKALNPFVINEHIHST